jgi:transcriptional regulator with XRE-family HTH domain
MMDYLSHNIAVNLNRVRISRGMSLDLVSEQTGVSKSMLYQIEKEEANPSINVLGKICSGLRVEFNQLISTPINEACVVKIKDLIPTKEVDGEYTVITCFPYEDNKQVELYRIDISPNGEYVSGGHGENTREYIAMIDGELTLEVNGKIYNLTKQNVFRFESINTHTYSNNTNENVSFWIFFVTN